MMEKMVPNKGEMMTVMTYVMCLADYKWAFFKKLFTFVCLMGNCIHYLRVLYDMICYTILLLVMHGAETSTISTKLLVRGQFRVDLRLPQQEDPYIYLIPITRRRARGFKKVQCLFYTNKTEVLNHKHFMTKSPFTRKHLIGVGWLQPTNTLPWATLTGPQRGGFLNVPLFPSQGEHLCFHIPHLG